MMPFRKFTQEFDLARGHFKIILINLLVLNLPSEYLTWPQALKYFEIFGIFQLASNTSFQATSFTDRSYEKFISNIILKSHQDNFNRESFHNDKLFSRNIIKFFSPSK